MEGVEVIISVNGSAKLRLAIQNHGCRVVAAVAWFTIQFRDSHV